MVLTFLKINPKNTGMNEILSNFRFVGNVERKSVENDILSNFFTFQLILEMKTLNTTLH